MCIYIESIFFYVTDKGLLSKIYKQLNIKQLYIKKKMKNGQKT